MTAIREPRSLAVGIGKTKPERLAIFKAAHTDDLILTAATAKRAMTHQGEYVRNWCELVVTEITDELRKRSEPDAVD